MREMIDNVNCIGTESKLIDCSHNIKQRISYSTPKVECLYGEHELTSIKHFFTLSLCLYCVNPHFCVFTSSTPFCSHVPHLLMQCGMNVECMNVHKFLTNNFLDLYTLYINLHDPLLTS